MNARAANIDVHAMNRAWEVDREALSLRSERRAWRVGYVSAAVAALAIATVFAQGRLQRVETVAVVVDRTTGSAHVESRLAEETIPAIDAVDMHNAARFVRARERYSWMFLQADYDQVARMATPVVFAEYRKHFEGEEDLTKSMGSIGEYQIEVISIRLPPQTRTGNTGEAIVTFDRTRKDPQNMSLTKRRFVATLRFEYRPKLLAKEADRIENPLGFLVTAYRADAELTNDRDAKS